MSLVSGLYFRGDPKQKPKQWGPASLVQTAFLGACEKLCINHQHIIFACPMWEKAGIKHYNYAPKTNVQTIAVTGTAGTWEKEKFFLNSTSSYRTYYDFSSGIITQSPKTISFLYDKSKDSNESKSLTYANYYFYCNTSVDESDEVSFRIANGALEATGINLTDITAIALTWTNLGVDVRGYVNSQIVYEKTGLAARNYYPRFYLPGNTSDTHGAYENFLCVDDVLNHDTIYALQENPWQLWQPPTFRTYFDIAGDGVISASCFDDVALSISSAKQAVFSALSSESLSLSVADQNMGNFISSLIDQINMSVVSDRSVSVNASAFDNIDMSGVPSSIQTIISLVNDDVYFSGSFVSNLHAAAVITEIINLSDTVSTDALSIISALAADVVNISDGSTIRADFISAILENFKLSAGAVSYLSALAASSDSINISGSAFWQGVQSAFAADGMFLNTQASAAIKILAATAESIMFDDAGGVTATFDVEVNNVVQFAETISAISKLRASLSDVIRIIATPMEISTLPNGKVSVSFSIRTPGAGFEMRTATIVFNLK